MRDNIFAEVFDDPFSTREEWFPLWADNSNAPPGADLPCFASYRRVSVAAFFFIIRKSKVPGAAGRPVAAPAGRTLMGRVEHWFLSDPA